MIIADCVVNEEDNTIDGIKFPYGEYIRRFMILINMELCEYDHSNDEMYDRKNKLD